MKNIFFISGALVLLLVGCGRNTDQRSLDNTFAAEPSHQRAVMQSPPAPYIYQCICMGDLSGWLGNYVACKQLTSTGTLCDNPFFSYSSSTPCMQLPAGIRLTSGSWGWNGHWTWMNLPVLSTECQ
jgi:hypothetical protein